MTAARKLDFTQDDMGQLYRQVRSGIPVTNALALADAISPRDKTFRNRLVSTSTLTRAADRLSRPMSEKVARVQRLWSRVRRIYADDGRARAFLTAPHAMLEQETPIDLTIDSEMGAVLVQKVLDGLEFGFAA